MVKISGIAGGVKATPIGTDLIEIEEIGGTSFYVTADNLSKALNALKIPNTPAGAIVATDIQTALNELDTEKQASILARIGASTFSTVQHLQDVFHSTGQVDGGVISNGIVNTVNVTLGTGLLRATDSPTVQLLYFDWSAATNLSVPLDTTRYIGVEYNAGSPQVVARTTDNFNNTTDFILGIVVNEATVLHISNTPSAVGDHAANMIQRSHEAMGIQRDMKTGGLAIGETGTRKITVTAGALWDRLSRFVISAIDTSVADTFDRYYSDGAGGHTLQSAQTDWNNTQYDDGTGVLATLGANKYSVQWFYMELDGELSCMFGTLEHNSQASAEDEPVPTDIPDRIAETTVLIGRLIFKNGDATALEIESAFDVSFGGAVVTDHGTLSGLADDDHTQYTLIESGAGAPSSTPSRVGQIYVDTTADIAYESTGTASSADWKQSTGTIITGTSGQMYVFDGSNDLIAVTMSGDATISNAGALTIAADAITYAKMQNVSATDKLLGRSTAGAGVVEEITLTSAGRALIDDASAAAQRDTLSAAVRTQVFGIQVTKDISDGVAKYIIDDDVGFAYEIVSLQACETDAGTATAKIKINDTLVTGISVDATTTKQTTADPATDLSSVSVTNEVFLDITAMSGATTLTFKVHCTRVLA